MVDPDALRNALSKLSYAALKVWLATHLSDQPLTQADYARITALERKNIQIALKHCVELGFLDRTDVTARQVHYTLSSRHLMASQQPPDESLRRRQDESLQRHMASQRLNDESLQPIPNLPLVSTPSDSNVTTRTESESKTVSAPRGAKTASESRQKITTTKVAEYAGISSQDIGDRQSIGFHIRVWAHTFRQNDIKLTEEILDLVRELYERHTRTGQPMGALFTTRVQRIFEDYGCPLVLKTAGQTDQEHQQEAAIARAALAHLQNNAEPTE